MTFRNLRGQIITLREDPPRSAVWRYRVAWIHNLPVSLREGMQKRESFHASLICYHARLVKVKNVSADVSERQALSSLIRCSRSRDPIMKYGSLSTLLMSRIDVSDASLAGLQHCRNVPPFAISSGWERSGNRFKRLLSCVGISKLLEWFLLFFRTMASSYAEDRRLTKDGGEVRIEIARIQILYAF
jgi:hypothetical protein